MMYHKSFLCVQNPCWWRCYLLTLLLRVFILNSSSFPIDRLRDERFKFNCNLDVQFLLKQGQVEVDSGPFIHDFCDSILIHRGVVEDLNGSIRVFIYLVLLIFQVLLKLLLRQWLHTYTVKIHTSTQLCVAYTLWTLLCSVHLKEIILFKSLHCVDIFCSQVHTSHVTH